MTATMHRRAVLAGALPVIAIPTTALAIGPAVDPIFAAIEEKKKALAAYYIKNEHSDEEVQQLCDADCEATRKLFRTIPTTLAGVAALVAHVSEWEKAGTDPLGAMYAEGDMRAAFLASLATALERLAA
jgi:hypothetical protein